MHQEYVNRLLTVLHNAMESDEIVKSWVDDYIDNYQQQYEAIESVSDITEEMIESGEGDNELLQERLIEAHDRMLKIADEQDYLDSVLRKTLGMSHLTEDDFTFLMYLVASSKEQGIYFQEKND